MGIEELCRDQPEEFKEFMHYCRGLSFTQDPDYSYIISLFEGCMKRHSFDTRNPDFIWNKNRLVLEKEARKREEMVRMEPPGELLEPSDRIPSRCATTEWR